MKPYLNVLEIISQAKPISNSYKEGWGNLELTGNYNTSIYKIFKDLDIILDSNNSQDLAKYWFDNDNVKIVDFNDYEISHNSFNKWKLTFNKQGFIEKKLDSDCYFNIFLTSIECSNWMNLVNPIEESNPINYFSPLKIIVKDLIYPIGSEYLSLIPADIKFSSHKFLNTCRLPNFESLQENTHFISETKIRFNPNTYALSEGEYDTQLSHSLMRQSSIALSVCIVDEYYSYEKVILNGLKRMKLSIYNSLDSYNYELIKNQIDLVKWLYEDKIQTRKKLFNERLTLEIVESQTLVDALKNYLSESLEQAKARYNFVILERKDAYLKELKELLKDLRTQSELYSQKIRTLLSNLLRDILTALVLVGFTIFTKFSDNIGLDKKKLLIYVFDALAVYFIISIIFQSIVDITDLSVTNKEIRYWKRASKELISDNEFDKYHTGSLNSRKISMFILYPLIAFLYFLIAFSCYKYPSVLESLIVKGNNVTK